MGNPKSVLAGAADAGIMPMVAWRIRLTRSRTLNFVSSDGDVEFHGALGRCSTAERFPCWHGSQHAFENFFFAGAKLDVASRTRRQASNNSLARWPTGSSKLPRGTTRTV